MNQPRLVALIASAFVLYVVASAGAAGVPLHAGVFAIAAVSLWSALVPLWLRRGEPDHAPPLVGRLAALLSLALSAWLAFDVHALVGEIVCAVALPGAGLSALRLALSAPDTPAKLSRQVRSERPVRVFSAVALCLGVFGALPPLWMFGRALIAPHWFARAPMLFGLSCAVLSTALRVARRKLGSDARALSANTWPALASSVALATLTASLIAHWLGVLDIGALQVTAAFAALVFVLGHVWMVSPQRALVASAWARELFASSVALTLTALVFVGLDERTHGDAPARAALWLVCVFAFEFVRSLARRVTRLLLSPHRARLLTAVDEVHRDVAGAPTYAEFAARVLRPLRRAASSPEAAPLLVSFHPLREVRLDAAGQPRVSERGLAAAIVTQLREAHGEPIVRDALNARLIRRPELRDVVWAMDEIDAVCVLPLSMDGEIEGALVLSRGARRDPLTLEELTALDKLGASIAPIASVFLMSERANHRAAEAARERSELRARVDDLDDELAQLRAQANLLKAGRGTARAHREPIQYSPAMAELARRLEAVAAHDVGVLLVSEPGIPLAPLGELIHRASGRREAPFVIGNCAELEPDNALRALFGVDDALESTPGWLELAGDGTLLLSDVAALSLDVQRALSDALAERRARALGAGSAYAVNTRIVATACRPLAELVSLGAIGAELSRWFELTSYDVPALRERREDIESLVLIAMDRAARVHGRDVPGIEPDALQVLSGYDWPGNLVELESVVERAVARCKGPRVLVADLPALSVSAGTSTAGSFVDQEREILRRALERADGNKTRAARSLGLKRTTLIDKLRKHGLDEAGPRSTEH